MADSQILGISRQEAKRGKGHRIINETEIQSSLAGCGTLGRRAKNMKNRSVTTRVFRIPEIGDRRAVLGL